MLIFASQITPRVQYVFDFIFRETLQLEYGLTSDEVYFSSVSDKVKWSYGSSIHGCPSLPAHRLLFENSIEPQSLSKIAIEDLIVLFEAENIDGIDYDVFASAFYLISRYEEYLPSVRDKHGRYAAYQSVATEFGFLETAMVNRYIFWIIRWLKSHFTDLEIKMQKPKILFSIDIDHPFYSKDLPLDKWLIRSIKNIGNVGEKDKFDTYDFILNTLGNISSIFFFLCPKNPSENDHFNKRDSENFKQLIHFIRSKSKIGIHPSYHSLDMSLIEEEIHWLSELHTRPIKSSRFHYLKNDIEKAYIQLEKMGVKYDFSMGYGDFCGFRSSTSLPYFYFDLKKNRRTELVIFTPCIMDSTFRYGSQHGFQDKLTFIYDEIKTYGGYFIPIFHNDILAENEWQSNFEFCVQLVKNEE